MRVAARARSFVGTQRANTSYAAGNIAASPIPMPMRIAISVCMERLAATGVASVNTDQANTDQPSTRLPPNFAAAMPAMNMKRK